MVTFGLVFFVTVSVRLVKLVCGIWLHFEFFEFEFSGLVYHGKRNKKGAGGRRATIAFADELQATLAEHLKTCETTEDKHAENGLLSPGINSLDVKPILKQHVNGETESMLVVILRIGCKPIFNFPIILFNLYIVL